MRRRLAHDIRRSGRCVSARSCSAYDVPATDSEGGVFPIRDLNPTRSVPVVTLVLIVVNLAVFFGWQPAAFWLPTDDPGAAPEFLYRHAAISCEVTTGRPLTIGEIEDQLCETDAGNGTVLDQQVFPEKDPPRSVIVSMFLHGGLLHILGNMWFLWLFGNNVEEAFGHVRYALLYLVGGVIAALAFVAMQPENTVPLVGASGAIAAMLGAYFVLFPGKLVLAVAVITIIPVPAVLFLGLWFIGQFFVGDVGVAWESHAAGFVVGALVAGVFRGPLLRRHRRLHRSD